MACQYGLGSSQKVLPIGEQLKQLMVTERESLSSPGTSPDWLESQSQKVSPKHVCIILSKVNRLFLYIVRECETIIIKNKMLWILEGLRGTWKKLDGGQEGKKLMPYGWKNYLHFLFLEQDKNYSLYSQKYCTFKYGRIEHFSNLN